MNIRQAVESDLANLADCAEAFYASSEKLHEFELDRFVGLWTVLIRNGSGVMFVLEDEHGRGLAGAIGGMVHPEPYSKGTVAQEMFWFVRPEARGGRGVALYKAFEAWAQTKKATEIRMGYLVDLMPEKVAHFYERAGFERVEVGYSKRLACAG